MPIANHTRGLLCCYAVMGKTNVTSLITFVNVYEHFKCYGAQSHVVTSYQEHSFLLAFT